MLLMAVTMVRLLTLLPGDAGTCRVTEDGNVMEWKMGGGKETLNSKFTSCLICIADQKHCHTF